MDEGDKNTCKEIARAIVKEVMVEHIKSCPHGQGFNILKAKLIGACLAAGVMSGGTFFGLAKLFGG